MNKLKIFPASVDSLYEMIRYICDKAKDFGFEESELGSIELAAEEALVNVIQHGYYGRNDGPIEIHCFQLKNPGIKIVIKDHGLAFNPLQELKRVKKRSDKPKEETPGGYGVILMDRVMDEIIYEYVDGTNTLTLIKHR